MNKNVIIVLVGALVVSVLVAFVVQMSLNGKSSQPQLVEEARVKILVAAKDLRIGQELGAEDLQWQDWPEGTLFNGAIVREDQQLPSEALSGRLSRNITAGEPMQRSAIVSETHGNFVAASLPPGMRAIAISASPSGMVGGFIGPGDYVDVVLTYRESVAADKDDPVAQKVAIQNLKKIAAETIVQNIKILGIDQTAERSKDDQFKVGKTVTLAVTAQEAETLALAQQMGDLSLVLRGVGDHEPVEKDWKTVSDARLITVDDEIYEEFKKSRKVSGKMAGNVRIYSGGTVLNSSSK